MKKIKGKNVKVFVPRNSVLMIMNLEDDILQSGFKFDLRKYKIIEMQLKALARAALRTIRYKKGKSYH